MTDDDDFVVEQAAREAARQELNRWIADAEQTARYTWEDGRSGYLGRIKICAFVGDGGLTFRIERSFSRGLP